MDLRRRDGGGASGTSCRILSPVYAPNVGFGSDVGAMNDPVSKNGPGEATDDELCARMGRGDSSALAALFQRHGSRLLFMGKVILGDASEAEDVVQEVFFEAWRKARTFDA